jgi:hypothetical protein
LGIFDIPRIITDAQNSPTDFWSSVFFSAKVILAGVRAAGARARDAALLDEAGSGARGLVAGTGRFAKERKVGARSSPPCSDDVP